MRAVFLNMERVEKENVMLRFAACLMSVISANKNSALQSDDGKLRKSKLTTSLRKLAAESGVDYATIQKIATGRKNPAWTTTVLLVEGLNLTMEEWGKIYDRLSQKDIDAFKAGLKHRNSRDVSVQKKKRKS